MNKQNRVLHLPSVFPVLAATLLLVSCGQDPRAAPVAPKAATADASASSSTDGAAAKPTCKTKSALGPNSLDLADPSATTGAAAAAPSAATTGAATTTNTTAAPAATSTSAAPASGASSAPAGGATCASLSSPASPAPNAVAAATTPDVVNFPTQTPVADPTASPAPTASDPTSALASALNPTTISQIIGLVGQFTTAFSKPSGSGASSAN